MAHSTCIPPSSSHHTLSSYGWGKRKGKKKERKKKNIHNIDTQSRPMIFVHFLHPSFSMPLFTLAVSLSY